MRRRDIAGGFQLFSGARFATSDEYSVSCDEPHLVTCYLSVVRAVLATVFTVGVLSILDPDAVAFNHPWLLCPTGMSFYSIVVSCSSERVLHPIEEMAARSRCLWMVFLVCCDILGFPSSCRTQCYLATFCLLVSFLLMHLVRFAILTAFAKSNHASLSTL